MAAKNFAYMAQRRKDKLSILNNGSTSFNVTLSAGRSGVAFSEEDLMAYPEYKAFTYIWHYCPPVLLVLGVVGNVITVVILRRVWRHGSSQLPFLLSLAVADLCLLVSGLLFDVSFYAFGFDLREFHVVPCRLLTFLMNSANSVSAWVLVAVTAQRALSVTRPHQVARFCSLAKCYWMLVGIVSMACLLHLHVLVGSHVPGVHPEGFCIFQESAETEGRLADEDGSDNDGDVTTSLTSMWSMLDLATACVLPSLTIIACHVILIRGLRASEKSLSSLILYDADDGGRRGRKSRHKLASSMTTAVRILSLSFICLTCPIYGYIIWSDARGEEIDSDPHLLARAELIWAVTNMLWYANPTANLLLYCVSGGKFRKELIFLVKQEFRSIHCCRVTAMEQPSPRKKACCSGNRRSPGLDTSSSPFPLSPTGPSECANSDVSHVLCSPYFTTGHSSDEATQQNEVILVGQCRLHSAYTARCTGSTKRPLAPVCSGFATISSQTPLAVACSGCMAVTSRTTPAVVCPSSTAISSQNPLTVVCSGCMAVTSHTTPAVVCPRSTAISSQNPLTVVCSAELAGFEEMSSNRPLAYVSSTNDCSPNFLCLQYPNTCASSTELNSSSIVSSQCHLTQEPCCWYSLAQTSSADVSGARPAPLQSFHEVFCSAELIRSNVVPSWCSH